MKKLLFVLFIGCLLLSGTSVKANENIDGMVKSFAMCSGFTEAMREGMTKAQADKAADLQAGFLVAANLWSGMEGSSISPDEISQQTKEGYHFGKNGMEGMKHGDKNAGRLITKMSDLCMNSLWGKYQETLKRMKK